MGKGRAFSIGGETVRKVKAVSSYKKQKKSKNREKDL